MLAAQFLSARVKRTLLLLLAMLAAYAGSAPFAAAQINASIDQSVWEMYYGLNPNQVTAAWLANQMPAGTNPLLPNSQLQVSTYSTVGSSVSLTFPTVTNKLYTMEVTSSLAAPITWTPVAGVSVAGNGSSKTLSAPKSDGAYFHIRVQDQSTAGDGVSDWAKAILGYSVSTSISSQTSYTSSTLATALATQNVVTLNATDPTASQPPAGTAANNLGTITVSRAGFQLFNTITVPLQVSGTAVPGTDYTALPSSVTFPAGVNTIPLNITPLANAAQLSATTVIVTAQAGGGYALGTPSSASILIYPNVTPAGTGLTGNYFAGSNTTYAPTPPTAANLGDGIASYSYQPNTNGGQIVLTYTNAATAPSTPFAGGMLVNLQFLTGGLSGGTFDTNYSITLNVGTQFAVLLPESKGGGSAQSGTVIITPYNTPTGTEVDPTVNFTWGTTTAPIAGIAAGSAFTVRWTGQVLATFTEPFWFSVNCTEGCKLWVNGQKIIDKWQTQTVNVTGSSTSSTIVTVASIPSGLAVNSWLLGAQVASISGTTVTLSADANANISSSTPVAYSIDQISSAISLQSGVFYDIKLEYLATAGTNNEVALQWFNNDMPEQVISQANLYPYITGFGASAAAAVTSPVTAAYVLGSGTPFTYTITGSNNASSFSASNLPSWLTLSGNTLSGTPPAAGTYQFTVTTTNSGGSSSVVVTLTVVDPPGSITREIWTGLAGTNVSNIPTTTTPTSTDTSLTSLEDASNYANNTGERLRGYFTAPTTGNYYFWVGASNAAELWISDDDQKVNLIRRAYVTGPTGTASRTWNTQTNQQSPWLSLVAGQKYYFEVLHNTGASGSSSNLSVAWSLDPTGSSGGIANNLGPAQPGNGITGGTGGIVPATDLWPWDYPTTTNTAGSVYLANLAPVSGVTTQASGGAYLSVNGSTGLLHLNYSGLSSGTLWRRIYTGTGVNQTLLFDIDAQAKNYPALETSDGGYTWTISNLSTLTGGLAYLTVATQNNPTGEISGSFALTSGSQTPPAVPSYPTWTNDSSTLGGASRFLSEASFGPSPADISYINSNSSYSTNAGYGYRAWIENEFALGPTTNTAFALAQLADNPSDPYPDTSFFTSWWRNSVTAPDQLRQRIAFALSEIMVTSDNGSVFNNNSRALASYYDTLLNDAFTNFNSILKDVTLSITMGNYLGMVANTPGNNQTGVHPNENYAREIMQLFSIGLYRLWPDGSLVLDDNGDPIPTYNQSVITGMAGVMTGWGWGQAIQSNGRLPTGFGYGDWIDPMILIPNQHQLTAKIVLDNAVLPAATVTSSSSTATVSPGFTIQYVDPTLGQGHLDTATVTNAYDANGLQDLQTALGFLSNHANVGPFICRQLIQRLVESNPSPAYVYRVSRAFNGQQNVDGITTGVVGDMKDTIRAILLDPEARNTAAAGSSTTFGKQREPLLRFTGAARAFRSTNFANGYANSAYRESGGQPMLITTTVPHNLTNGDTIQLDNVVDNDSPASPPTSQGYSVANVTSSYSVVASSGIATVNSGGYKVGDTVQIQFISGTLGATSPYNTVQSYTVQNVTATSFTVNISTSIGTASGNAITPYNFVLNNGSLGSVTYSTNSTGSTLTINASNNNYPTNPPYFPVGAEIYLSFPVPSTGTSALSGGSYNGLYSVATAAATSFTVTPLAAGSGGPSSQGSPWPVSASGSVLYPEYNECGCTVTVSGGTSNLFIQTNGSNELAVGDTVQLTILASNSPAPVPSGVYTVASTPGPNSFNITVNSVLTAGATAGNSCLVFPLSIRQWNRSGTATIDFGTYTVGDTDTTISQTPLNAPTVFNFFYPTYEYPGAIANAGITTPEFQLTNASNTMNLTNTISGGVLSGGNLYGFTSLNTTNGTVELDLSPYATSAQTVNSAIPTLVQTLATTLCGTNNLTSTTQSAISSYITGTTSFSNNTGFGLTTGNPCTVSTTNPHGLTTGTSVTIAGVTGGTFSPTINGTFSITVTGPTTFTVPVNYSSSSGIGTSSANFTSTNLTNQLALARVRAIVQLIITSAEYAIQQ